MYSCLSLQVRVADTQIPNRINNLLRPVRTHTHTHTHTQFPTDAQDVNIWYLLRNNSTIISKYITPLPIMDYNKLTPVVATNLDRVRSSQLLSLSS